MAVYSFRTGVYARNIYLYGNERFTARDGFNGIAEEYHEPVKQYAAKNFTLIETDNALFQTWITQEEYDGTIAYRTEASPMQAVKYE